MDALFVKLLNDNPDAGTLNALSMVDAVTPLAITSVFGLPVEPGRFDVRIDLAADRVIIFDILKNRRASIGEVAGALASRPDRPGARSAGPLVHPLGDLSRAVEAAGKTGASTAEVADAFKAPAGGGELKLIDAMLNPDSEFLDRASWIIQRAYKNDTISGPAETALMDFVRRRAVNLVGPLGVAAAISRYASASPEEGCDSRLQAAFSAIALCDLVTLAKALSSERPVTREKDVEHLRVSAPILGAERDAPSRGPVPEAIPSLGDRLVKLFAMARGRRPPHYLPGTERLTLIRETIISTWGSDSDFTAHLLATLEVVIKCEEEIDRAVEIDRAAHR